MNPTRLTALILAIAVVAAVFLIGWSIKDEDQSEGTSDRTVVDSNVTAVRVIDRASKKGVPGAMVYVVSESTLHSPEAFQDRSRFSIHRFAQTWGTQHVANEDGLVVVSVTPRSLVCARQEDRWGIHLQRANSAGEAVIEIEPVTAIEIEVVDGSGARVEGVPLRLHIGELDAEVETTDTNGRATLRVDRAIRQTCKDMDGKLAVGWGFPTRDSASVEVDLQTPPQDVIRLVLPPTGRVSVRIGNADGQPLGLGLCQIASMQPSREKPDREFSGTSYRPIIDGVAEHPFVGLGLKLELTAMKFSRGQPSDMVTTEIEGPALPNQRIEAEMTFKVSRTHLTMRAVDENGAPLTHRDLQVTLDSADETMSMSSWSAPAYTDESGLFEIPAPAVSATRLKLTVNVQSKGESGKVIAGQSVFWIDSAASIDTLGDIRLLESTPFAAGTVKDVDGRPVSGTRINLSVIDASRLTPNNERSLEWVALGRDVYSDSDGRFVIHAELPQGEYVVQPGDSRFAIASSQPFRKGATDVVLVVERSSEAKGRILVDDEAALRALSVAIAQPINGTSVHASYACKGGTFEVFGLRSGPALVTISLGQFRSYLGTQETTQFRSRDHPGLRILEERTINLGSADDVGGLPDLQFDLRGRLKVIRVDAIAMLDARREGVMMESLDPQGHRTFSSRSEPFELVIVDGQPLTIQLSADGFESKSLANVDSDVVVTLTRSK